MTQTTQQVRNSKEANIARQAAKAFAKHVVTAEHEGGLYRHYRCAAPNTGFYAFHVVTFPGRLILCGDIGDMAWDRCPDMLEWAKDAIDSVGYFAEKCWSSLKVKEWCSDVARAVVEDNCRDYVENDGDAEKHGAVRDELLEALDEGEYRFNEAYADSPWYGGDWPDFRDYTADFLWAREAVRWFLAWQKSKTKGDVPCPTSGTSPTLLPIPTTPPPVPSPPPG